MEKTTSALIERARHESNLSSLPPWKNCRGLLGRPIGTAPPHQIGEKPPPSFSSTYCITVLHLSLASTAGQEMEKQHRSTADLKNVELIDGDHWIEDASHPLLPSEQRKKSHQAAPDLAQNHRCPTPNYWQLAKTRPTYVQKCRTPSLLSTPAERRGAGERAATLKGIEEREGREEEGGKVLYGPAIRKLDGYHKGKRAETVTKEACVYEGIPQCLIS
jgi:hypothetical protein